MSWKSFRVMRILYLAGVGCQGVSVILGENTASGTEIFPVFVGDRGIGGETHRCCDILADDLFPRIRSVDEDENSLPVVVTDEDFEMIGDRVVVDDVVHASIVLRKWQGVKH